MYCILSVGNARFQMRHQICTLKNHLMCKSGVKNRVFLGLKNEYSFKIIRHSICCSNLSDNHSTTPSITQTTDAKVIYSVAPALGHNKESHPECNSRVPAIMDALEKMELTSKFRGSEVIELQSLRPASVDDIASVHAKAYVSGLEKVMDQASEKGLIYIDGSGPTYATATTFQESLLAAGAGISLVDSVVISQSKTLLHQKLAIILLLALL